MTVPFAHYRDTMEKLVTSAGGIVEDHLFVTKPGVVILETTEPTKEAINIYRTMNIHLEENENNSYLSSGEFKARITYLAYPREQPLDDEKTNAYHNKMIKELKHYSPYDGTTVTFLIAGVSVESGLEFVAHREATVARLTSSKTHAQDYTLYRIQPHVDVDAQKKLVHSFLETFRNPQIQNESSRKNLGLKSQTCTIYAPRQWPLHTR
jgi:thymidylate synthase ThyX